MICRFSLIFVLVLACAGVAGAGQQPAASFETTFDVGSVDYLYFVIPGNAVVRVGESGKIKVTGRPRLKDGARKNAADKERELQAILQNPPLRLYGRSMLYLGRPPKGKKIPKDWWIDFEVEAPPDTRRILLRQEGEFHITGLHHLTLVSARRGSVLLRDVSGGLGENSNQVLQVRTRDARIHIQQELLGRLEATSQKGEIRISAQPTDYWHVESEKGHILVEVPADAAFHLSAVAKKGRVENNVPLRAVGVQGGYRVNGKVRGGHHRVELRTDSGRITIQEMQGERASGPGRQR